MYIAVCDDQTEELKDLTELLGAWETDRGTPVRVKSFRSAAALLDAARHERFTAVPARHYDARAERHGCRARDPRL